MNDLNGKVGTSSSTSSDNDAKPKALGGTQAHDRPTSQAQQQYPPYGQYMNWRADRGAEDESIHYLSEPSLSEEGDSTTEHLDRSLLSGEDEDTDDNQGTPPPPPPGPPPMRNSLSSAASTGVASPGNTSLSSWESHFRPQNPHHRVRIHFSPETTDRDQYHQYNNTPSPYYTQYQAQRLFPPQNERTEQQQPCGEDVSESASVLRQHTRHNRTIDSSSRNAASSQRTNNLSYSTLSMSTMSSLSTKERKNLDDFILDLRQHSQGALQDSSGNVSLLNTSTEGSGKSQQPTATLDTVLRAVASDGQVHVESKEAFETPLRATHRRISSVETELIGNTSETHVDDTKTPQQEQHRAYSIDDSPLMLNLSVLGDEEDDDEEEKSAETPSEPALSAGHPKPSFSSSNSSATRANDACTAGESSQTTTDDDDLHLADSDQNHHSADDEQTEIRPPRRRTFNVAGGKPSPVHRRTRSGDRVAAALTTGGQDWVGMLENNIPMPDGVDDDDEDDDEAEKPQVSSPEKVKSFTEQANANNPHDRAVFALGATDATTASRAAARRQRREQRQQQRTMAEKAAAAARQQRIQKQFQEWSHSPLWNQLGNQKQEINNSAAADSSESNSLGSVPSTVVRRVMLSVASDPGCKIRTHSAPQMQVDNEGPRNSLDTVSSNGLSLSSEAANGQNYRRNSMESHRSLFSWISTSNQENSGVEHTLSPTSPSPRHTIHVHPNWTPQTASLASPILQRRNQELQRTREAQHQRSRTSIGNYVTSQDASQSLSHSWRPEPEDPFRRLLMQQQQQHQIHETDSFRLYSGQSPQGPFPALHLSASSKDPFLFHRHSLASSGSGSQSTTTSEDEEDDDVMGVMQNQCRHIHPDVEINSLDEAERSAEAELLKLGSQQHVLRGSRLSPFANFGKKAANGGGQQRFDRQSFLPKTSVLESAVVGSEEKYYPTYRCPRCNTIQREFFTVNNAPRQYETASGFLALSFVVYVIASLYIFGLEEGWPALDCIYFAVITLTTAGLGDLVPTSSFNKIICSIFIYFGVACIGLLLGSYIASMLDETSRRQARENRINACPNCARLQNIKDAAEKRQLSALAISLHNHSVLPSAGPGQVLPNKKHSSERISFGRPRYPYAFNTDLDESDDSFHSVGNKKIKRQHNSGNEVSGLSSDFRSPSSIPGKQGDQAPPLAASNGSAKSSSQAATNATPTHRNTSEAAQGEATNAGSEKHCQLVPPKHGATNAMPEGPSLPGSSRSPVSPATPRTTVSSPRQPDLLGSPMTKQILGRQSHTRHASFDVSGMPSADNLFGRSSMNSRIYTFEAPRINDQPPTINENVPFVPGTSGSVPQQPNYGGVHFEGEDSFYSDEVMSTDDSSAMSSDSYSTEESDILDFSRDRVKTAKYVFETLREALVNSLVIIAVGCLGFWGIEGFSFVDSWYFTTVLLTTVGYGDIVPITRGGKLFATIYILVAGTILLNNMSLISMIPLELRKRRIERAVLTQFGDLLDDDALRELASGPLIQRLHLTRRRADGLNECTREMFALAMLVRLGKVTEDDILGTFGAFNRLDVNRDGVLNSRSIIAGMIHKSKSKANTGGMRRVGSSNSLLKTPSGPVPPLLGGQQSYTTSMFAPASSYHAPNLMSNPITIPQPPHGPIDESTSLLHNAGGARLSMLSRSG